MFKFIDYSFKWLNTCACTLINSDSVMKNIIETQSTISDNSFQNKRWLEANSKIIFTDQNKSMLTCEIGKSLEKGTVGCNKNNGVIITTTGATNEIITIYKEESTLLVKNYTGKDFTHIWYIYAPDSFSSTAIRVLIETEHELNAKFSSVNITNFVQQKIKSIQHKHGIVCALEWLHLYNNRFNTTFLKYSDILTSAPRSYSFSLPSMTMSNEDINTLKIEESKEQD